MKKIIILLVLVLTFGLIGCGGGAGGGGGDDDPIIIPQTKTVIFNLTVIDDTSFEFTVDGANWSSAMKNDNVVFNSFYSSDLEGWFDYQGDGTGYIWQGLTRSGNVLVDGSSFSFNKINNTTIKYVADSYENMRGTIRFDPEVTEGAGAIKNFGQHFTDGGNVEYKFKRTPLTITFIE